ncbi:pentapeptide repeat-containing protein [Neptunomonas sp.]|uniref:pentapeptide repeat-containing protein n=1 Tax=Neptunomonas sp. TaxID=1971898 RepID=UPI0025EF67A5|nr:pentapeptide repeat-containing protein [Neptunomonas sp.]
MGTTFGEGRIDFSEATFGEGRIDFSEATFGEGRVYFIGATFGEGDVDFTEATFGKGGVYFRGTTFGEGDVDFSRAQFLGSANFSGLNEASAITSLYFRHCTFNHSLDLSGNRFICIPDLTNTKLTHQVSLDGLVCEFRLNEKGIPDPKDGERLCRLKEIAEANKNHEQALNFHIEEMRVKRPKLSGWLNKKIDKYFDAVSEYGRSIIKPLHWLIRSWYVFGLIYSCISIGLNPMKPWWEHFGNGFLYAAAQVVPFVAAGRESSRESINALFGKDTDTPNWLFTISLTQGLISFLLIFLIGLALRNRFRI